MSFDYIKVNTVYLESLAKYAKEAAQVDTFMLTDKQQDQLQILIQFALEAKTILTHGRRCK